MVMDGALEAIGTRHGWRLSCLVSNYLRLKLLRWTKVNACRNRYPNPDQDHKQLAVVDMLKIHVPQYTSKHGSMFPHKKWIDWSHTNPEAYLMSGRLFVHSPKYSQPSLWPGMYISDHGR